MKNRSVLSLLIVVAMMFAAFTPTFAATRLQQKDVDLTDHQVSDVLLDMPIESPELWTSYETASAKNALGASAFTVVDDHFSVFALDLGRMDAVLANAPAEFSTFEKRENYQMTLPMPDGSLQRFRVWDSPIMEPALAAEYPDVRTYVGQGVDDPTATVRFDRTPLGFHAMVISAGRTVFVDPYAAGDIQNYISYDKRGLRRDTANMPCLVDDAIANLDRENRASARVYAIEIADDTTAYAIHIGATQVIGKCVMNSASRAARPTTSTIAASASSTNRSPVRSASERVIHTPSTRTGGVSEGCSAVRRAARREGTSFTDRGSARGRKRERWRPTWSRGPRA